MTEPLHPEVAIMNAALELPSDQRAKYLEAACGNDQTLRGQVAALLAAHEAAPGFLDLPLCPRPEHSHADPGDHIGPYKLLQRIGEGGCGVVYMAEQEEPVRRRVALK